MNTSAARFAATIAASAAILVGVGVGATAIARSSAGADPDPTVGDAVLVDDSASATPEPSPSGSARDGSDDVLAKVPHSPSVDDLDDDHDEDREGGVDDDSVALPPGDSRLGTVPGSGDDDGHERSDGSKDDHETHDDEHDDD
ncbi:hypothetical protein [Demequina rhizosphaerae]|uniref:hypothetical protein n=1 Tax=Demequina rhizosphaerae TaxID=1638985 RepID=UPI0007813123|nr:hypothetical protein [Demequina rhizosphaerae]